MNAIQFPPESVLWACVSHFSLNSWCVWGPGINMVIVDFACIMQQHKQIICEKGAQSQMQEKQTAPFNFIWKGSCNMNNIKGSSNYTSEGKLGGNNIQLEQISRLHYTKEDWSWHGKWLTMQRRIFCSSDNCHQWQSQSHKLHICNHSQVDVMQNPRNFPLALLLSPEWSAVLSHQFWRWCTGKFSSSSAPWTSVCNHH